MTIQIEVIGAKEIADQYEAVAKDLEDFQSFGDVAIQAIAADVNKRFESSPATRSGGVVWGGVTWRRLSEAYLQSRPDRSTGKVLIDTGELRQSFAPGSSGNVARVEGKTVTFGSNLEKATAQHPSRPLIFIHPDLVENVITQWEAKLVHDLKK